MKQEVTRKHKAEKWALDDVVYHTEVTSFDRMEQVTLKSTGGPFHFLQNEGRRGSSSRIETN